MQTAKTFQTDNWIEEGITNVSNKILTDNSISPQAKVLYMQLKMHCFKKDYCFPGQDRLAEYNGVSVRTIQNWLSELEEKNLIKITQRGKNETNLYFLSATRKSMQSDTKENSHKDFKEFNNYNNNKNQTVDNSNVNNLLSNEIVQAFKKSFNHDINMIQAQTLYDYLNKFNVKESLIVQVVKEDGLGNNTTKFFFTHLEMLKEANIKTLEQYQEYQKNKKKTNKVSYINDYREKKNNKNSIIDDENVRKLQDLIEKKYNEKINHYTLNKLLEIHDLRNILKVIPVAENFAQLYKRLNYQVKNTRKNFKKDMYR